MNNSLLLWVGFNLFVLAMLALDLGVFHRHAHAVTIREALTWTAGWVVLALIFDVVLWRFTGKQSALEFLTGYLIEKSLSVDNLFVFALVFSYFGVAPKYQHRVLFWGILGALLMRGAMIGLGTSLIHHFRWILYLFGAFLIFTGVRIAFKKEISVYPEKNPVVRLFKKLVPVSGDFHEDRLFVREAGVLCATPLMVVLVCVEVTDLMFATDSIPAIFAVTLDPFIVYTSNVFAILGLRSLYFALAGMMGSFRFLKFGLSLILAFIGLKMLLTHTAWKIGTLPALILVALVLAGSVVVSLLRPNREDAVTPNRKPQHLNKDVKLCSKESGSQAEPAAPIASAPHASFSQELRHLAGEVAENPVRLSQILVATQGRGFDLLLLFIALPFLTPIPLPGFSMPFGLVAFFIGARLAMGRKPWLPQRLLERELPPQFVSRVLKAASRVVRVLELFLRPRLVFLQDSFVFQRLAGALIMLSGLLLVLPLPIPFSNSLPALTVLLLAAGALERDGLFYLAGCFTFLLSAVYFTFLALGGAHLLDQLLHNLTGG